MGFFTDSNRSGKEAQRRAIEEAKEREARAREIEQEQARRAQEAAENQRQEFQNAQVNKRNQYLDTTKGYAAEKLKASGINDTYGINDYFQKLLNQRAAGVGEGADLSSAINPEEIYQQAYGDVREGVRRTATGRVNQEIGQDYGKRMFGDTADDAILDSILATQRGSATAAVDRARSRGILNDAGLTAATAELGTRGTAARSQMEDIGGGVLSRFRGALDTDAENLRSRAGSLDLTDNFDITGAITGLTGKTKGFQDRLEGDIRGAVGDTDFFDTAGLLGKAASNQGFNNPGGNAPLMAAFVEGAGKKENDPTKKRLYGSTGAF